MDLKAFAAASVELHQRLNRAVYAVSGDLDLAEDSAQEALTRAWQRLEGGDPISSLDAWCITVALNWCRSQQRRQISDRRKAERVAAVASTSPNVGGRDPALGDPAVLGEDVRQAVLNLPLRQREVVVLHYLLDLSVNDISDATGRSTGAVKNALHHARRSLARELDNPQDPSMEDAS